MAMAKVYLIRRNGVFHVRYQKNGKWTKKSLKTRKRAEAQIGLARFLRALEERPASVLVDRKVTFRQLADEYLVHARSHKARKWYETQKFFIERNMVEHFGPDRLVTEITSRDIEAYQRERYGAKKWYGRDSVKASTVNRELACLKAMFRKAEEWGYVAVSPARRVKPLPKDDLHKERFLSVEEYPILLGAAEGVARELRSDQFQALPEFIAVACHTGLRKQELLNMEFSDIDFGRRVLRVRNKPRISFRIKNYQERHIPLSDVAIDALLRLLERKHPDCDFVFHRKGRRWKSIDEAFAMAVDRSDIRNDPPENVTIHTLRHTAASHWAMMGIPLRVIQQLLGHRNLSTTERYAHLAPDTMADVVRQMTLVPKSVPALVSAGSKHL
jgi:integrase